MLACLEIASSIWAGYLGFGRAAFSVCVAKRSANDQADFVYMRLE